MSSTPRSSLAIRASFTGVAAAGLLAGNLAAAGPDDFRTYDAATFYETTSIFGASFSADETRLLITSDASGVFNLYTQPDGFHLYERVK